MIFTESSLKSCKKLTPPIYKIERNAQDAVPVARIAENGVFQVTDNKKGKNRGMNEVFDRAYILLDTNYATRDEEQKEDFLRMYCRFLNTLSIPFKTLIINGNRDTDEMQRSLFIRNEEGDYKEIVNILNEHIRKRIEKGRSGIEQVKVFVVSCERQSYGDALDFFRTLEANLMTNFDRLESGLIPLNATERLRLLHNIYRLGKEMDFSFNFELSKKMGRDFRNDICSLAIDEKKDHMELEDMLVRVLFAKSFPNSLSDNFITKLTNVSFPTITTIDAAPIPKPIIQKKLTDMYMSNGRAIAKQQDKHNEARAYSSDISYEKRREKEEIEEYMDVVRSNDENMFYMGLYVVIMAGTMKELDSRTITIKTIGDGDSLGFETHIWNQLDAFKTSLPVACRYVDTMRTLFTQSLAAFMPFNVQELHHADGQFYGINRISGNGIFGNRKKLINGNGFVLGTTGAGKSMESKQEMAQVKLNTNDDIIVIDPKNEYEVPAKLLGGQFINISSASKNHINPMDTSTFTETGGESTFIREKSDLILGICEQILNCDISATQRSICDRCMRIVYDKHFKTKAKDSPTMKDLYKAISEQPEAEAKDLKLALELFVEGSLNIFSFQTNVNTKNKFTVYGMRDLGKQLWPVGMLIMLESIRSRIASNAARGIATWLYIDEFHNLSSKELSAEYLEKIWKEVRYLGGICTGITQNIADLLVTKRVETMLSNSEYINLLPLSKNEKLALEEILDLNAKELEFVSAQTGASLKEGNSQSGIGLMKFGQQKIPKNNRVPNDNPLYDLFNTNFHEIQEKKKKMKKKEITKAVARLPGQAGQTGMQEEFELLPKLHPDLIEMETNNDWKGDELKFGAKDSESGQGDTEG